MAPSVQITVCICITLIVIAALDALKKMKGDK